MLCTLGFKQPASLRQAWLVSQCGLLLCRWYCHAWLVNPFLDSHELCLQELYSSQVRIRLFLYCILLTLWYFIDYLKGNQYKQPKQYIWQRFRAVMSEVPYSYKELFFPADQKEVWQVRWAISCAQGGLPLQTQGWWTLLLLLQQAPQRTKFSSNVYIP